MTWHEPWSELSERGKSGDLSLSHQQVVHSRENTGRVCQVPALRCLYSLHVDRRDITRASTFLESARTCSACSRARSASASNRSERSSERCTRSSCGPEAWRAVPGRSDLLMPVNAESVPLFRGTRNRAPGARTGLAPPRGRATTGRATTTCRDPARPKRQEAALALVGSYRAFLKWYRIEDA